MLWLGRTTTSLSSFPFSRDSWHILWSLSVVGSWVRAVVLGEGLEVSVMTFQREAQAERGIDALGFCFACHWWLFCTCLTDCSGGRIVAIVRLLAVLRRSG